MWPVAGHLLGHFKEMLQMLQLRADDIAISHERS
jgi:hypothetical protein